MAGWLKSVIKDVYHYNFSGSAVDGEMPVYRLGWYPEGGEKRHEESIPERKYSVFVQYGADKRFTFSYGVFDEGVVFHVDPLGHEMVHSTRMTVTVIRLPITPTLITPPISLSSIDHQLNTLTSSGKTIMCYEFKFKTKNTRGEPMVLSCHMIRVCSMFFTHISYPCSFI